MNVRVGILSVMRMHPVSTLMVAFTATVTLATVEVVILEIAMVHKLFKVPEIIIITCFIDIDECVLELDDCHDNATCNNTIGSYTCMCNDGFEGNGSHCISKFNNRITSGTRVLLNFLSSNQDINECLDSSLNDCDMNASCMDTFGSYMCSCNDGYFGNGFNCSGKASVAMPWLQII